MLLQVDRYVDTLLYICTLSTFLSVPYASGIEEAWFLPAGAWVGEEIKGGGIKAHKHACPRIEFGT